MDEKIMNEKIMDEKIMTRYLYLKDEVKISLMFSLLNGKDEEALFWAFELYHSGFFKELENYLWQLYYDFYFTLNPSFEAFFLKKQKQKEREKLSGIGCGGGDAIGEVGGGEEMYIANIVCSLCIRPFTLDVFLLREMTQRICFELDGDDAVEAEIFNKLSLRDKMQQVLESKDYERIALFIMVDLEVYVKDTDTKEWNNLFDVVLEFFGCINAKKSFEKMVGSVIATDGGVRVRTILLSRILHFFVLREKKSKLGKSIYMNVEPYQLEVYKTVESVKEDGKEGCVPRKLLKQLLLYSSNEHGWLHLFKPNGRIGFGIDGGVGVGVDDEEKRNRDKKEFFWNWMYYASFSPLWFERIRSGGGKVNHETKTVNFDDDDLFDSFCNLYDYELEEQPCEIQEKCLPILGLGVGMRMGGWVEFYEEYSNRCKGREGLYIPSREILEAF